MKKILKTIQENRVDYEDIIRDAEVSIRNDDAYIRAIIGVRGRHQFLEPTINSINQGGNMVSVTIVECDTQLQHSRQCRKLGVNYIGIKTKKDEQYNRSLAFNVGAILSGKCEWLLTHDIDCVVKDNFFSNLLKNTRRHGSGAVQSFNKRRVLYCSTKLSKSLIRDKIDVNGLCEESDGISTCAGKAPGGSIFINRDLFFEVGGYDPELFYGYAPEDRFFWDKVSIYEEIRSASNPVTDIFHLHHEPMMGTNPELGRMIKIADTFGRLNYSEKLNIVKYKQEILSSWL